MWVSEKLVNLFQLSKETVDDLKEECRTLRSENMLLQTQLSANRVMTDWLRGRVNTLEMEKGALLAKAFNVNIPVPEIVRTSRDLHSGAFQLDDLFAGPPLSAYDEVDETV